jgi:tetratricopeptide (TPR) repeat protein
MNTRLTASAFTLLALMATLPAFAQEDPRKLFESGRYQEAVGKIGDDQGPDAQFLKGLAHRKLGQNDDAKRAFGRLSGAGDPWGAVGESAVALTDGNLDGALGAAQRAVEQNAGLAEAQFQLGMVQEARNDNASAAAAFAKAAEASPQMAYAHYHAGINYYKAKRVDRMAVFFENFLKLAPDSPEKPAVESIMRTVRGR